MTKVCKNCKKRKRVSMFYPQSNERKTPRGTCKACTNIKSMEWQEANWEKVLTSSLKSYYKNRERLLAEAKTPQRRAHSREVARKYRKRNTARMARYEHTKKRRMAKHFRRMKYNRNNPQKMLAYNIYKRAIRHGILKRGPCFVCRTSKRIEGHHPDYSKPLNIVWLCHKHHKAEHIRLRL